MFISRESQLANVDDVFNGILVRGDATGDVVFYGKGAGKLPTASAVVADVIDCVRHLKSDRKILFWEDAKPDYVQPWEDTPQDLFLRVAGEEDSDSLFDKAQQVFPSAVRLIRKDELPGEAGSQWSSCPSGSWRSGFPRWRNGGCVWRTASPSRILRGRG